MMGGNKMDGRWMVDGMRRDASYSEALGVANGWATFLAPVSREPLFGLTLTDRFRVRTTCLCSLRRVAEGRAVVSRLMIMP
jgi:hypothetical protein